MNLYFVPGKPLPFILSVVEKSKPTFDMHGDILQNGGEDIGVFVRTTPSGKGITVRRKMSDVTPHINNT